MKSKPELKAKYQLFGSPTRGQDSVEAELSALMKGMTTPANVKKLGEVVEGPLGITAEKLKALKEAFKRIDEEKKAER